MNPLADSGLAKRFINKKHWNAVTNNSFFSEVQDSSRPKTNKIISLHHIEQQTNWHWSTGNQGFMRVAGDEADGGQLRQRSQPISREQDTCNLQTEEQDTLKGRGAGRHEERGGAKYNPLMTLSLPDDISQKSVSVTHCHVLSFRAFIITKAFSVSSHF